MWSFEMKPKKEPESDIISALGVETSSGRGRRLKRIVLVGGLALLTVAVFYALKTTGKGNSIHYKTRDIERGSLTVTVSATGTLEPTNQVDVGSELSGIIKTVEVDYNDQVKIDQVLARMDTSKLQAQVMQSKAALESALAKVQDAQATGKEAADELDRLLKVRELSRDKVPSKQEMDSAKAALQRARAAEAVAKAQVSQAKATLEANETDMAKSIIRSPINGIVLSRNVEPGQTVAASFQAPVLFTLAEDLTKMELHVDVDEADVGMVEKNQAATFTVDAYPDRTFSARITQVRYGAKTLEGVVTYETLLDVENTDLVLRPGMTATADITVRKIENAVLIPNAALRFTPPVNEFKALSNGGSFLSKLIPHPPRRPLQKQEEIAVGKGHHRVWTVRDGRLVAIPITTGLTNGVVTEVTGGDLKPGMAVVIDTVSSGK
jgi:HlyD family secretion protein